MNKSLEIKKHTYILFFINLAVLFTLILFKTYFSKMGYYVPLVSVMFFVNIAILILGIILNIKFFRNPNRYDESKTIKIIIISFIVYLIINTLGVYLINKPIDAGYTEVSAKISGYCDTYGCDRYETVKDGLYEDFIIRKTYVDYNGMLNDIEIHTNYSPKEIREVKAIIYSENEMFSETLIYEQLKNYFINFNYTVSESKIREAFDKRFEGKVTDGKAVYKVSEVYNDGRLEKLKTQIILKIKK